MATSVSSTDFALRESEIRALKSNPSTKRVMALGDRYQELQISTDALKEVEEDFRRARLYEVVTMSHAMREVELDEQRRLVAERQGEEGRLRQVWLEDFHRMRQKAFDVLIHEADTVKAEEARRLEADKRSILQVERSRLLERRTAFESTTVSGRVNNSTYQNPNGTTFSTPNRLSSTARSTTPIHGVGIQLPPNPHNVPLLVMNVTLGNGREEKITVRVNDDPKRIAVNFAKKHQLPDSAAVNLSNQIRSHLNSRLGTSNPAAFATSEAYPEVGYPTAYGAPNIGGSIYGGGVGGTAAGGSISRGASAVNTGGYSPSAATGRNNSPSISRRVY
eukprot:GILI01015797.1.p1 GENE.GILI01015797.1~~GILI01015797.1.p1  ORF type:complete len:334 (-),score=40.53 GILI01015797.1:89-1090(-)